MRSAGWKLAGNRVEIQIVGDDAEMLRAWQRQRKETDKLAAKLDKVGRAGKRSGRQVKSGFDSALGTFGKFAGAITGIGGAVGGVALAANQLYAEFRRIKELQQTDASKQIEFEKSLVNAIRNAGDFFTGKEIKATTLKLSGETGVSPKIIADVISSTLSKRGATNKEQALEAISGTKAALKFAPELDAEGAAILAGSSVNISKKTGYSPQEAIGLAQNVSALASITSPELIAKNVTPALNALLEFKNTPQQAGSLIAAITQGSEDSTGERSRTAAIQLAKQIEERGIGGSTAEGLRMIQQDPELRKRFFEGGEFNGKKFPGASVEATAYTTVKQLANANSDLAKSYIAGIDQVGGQKEARERYEKTVSQVRSVTPTSRQAREAAAAADIANIKDEVGGRAANARNTLNKALDAANYSDYRRKMLLGRFEFGSSAGQEEPEKIALEIIKRERKRLESTVDMSGNGGLGSIVPLERKVSKEDRFSADQLRNFEEILSKEAKEFQNVKEQEGNVKDLKPAMFSIPPERFLGGGKKPKYGNSGTYILKPDGSKVFVDNIPTNQLKEDNPQMRGDWYHGGGMPTNIRAEQARREVYENPEKYKAQIAETKRLNQQYQQEREKQDRFFQQFAQKGELDKQMLDVLKEIAGNIKPESSPANPPPRRPPYKAPAEKLSRGK